MNQTTKPVEKARGQLAGMQSISMMKLLLLSYAIDKNIASDYTIADC